jgi:hypothetical protein
MPNKNAIKGHNLERAVVNDIKPFWKWVKTSRLVSRLLDNCKIDLAFFFANIQCKATKMRPNYQSLYEDCIKAIDENYSPDEAKILKEKPYIVIHKDTTRRAGNNKPHVQTMTVTYEFGLELLELYAIKIKENESIYK